MRVDYAEARSLLRQGCRGALGSHSVSAPGYPFVTALPYVPDGESRPLFLLSGLAEHSRNLIADPRASLLVTGGEGGLLDDARLTLLGMVRPVVMDEASLARFLRYSPESAEYLSLGDFRFFRMEPARVRFIGGFGRMGWAEATCPSLVLAPAEEEALVDRLAHRVPVGTRLLGVDFEGIDMRISGVFRRFALCPKECSVDAIHEAAAETLSEAGNDLPRSDDSVWA